jgi:tRNA(fMet)-specific endonuclease VapC
LIPLGELILPDTNILVHLVRGNDLGKRIEADYQLRARTERTLISVITIGEALALARKWNWGQDKIDKLKKLFTQLVVVDINRPSILDKYAEISFYLETKGLSLGQNDMWIAATVSVTDSHLLAADKDFDRLYPTFIKREWIDPNQKNP